MGREKLEDILERFSVFGLPLHFTENTLVSGHIMPADIVDLNDYQVDEWPSTPEGEERQKNEWAQMYRILFEHPLVEALTLGILNYKDMIVDLLKDILKNDGIVIEGVYERSDAKERKKEGLTSFKGFIGPEFDTDIEIVENNVHYMVDVVNGQKTGFYQVEGCNQECN